MKFAWFGREPWRASGSPVSFSEAKASDMKSLFLRAFLLLAVYECNAQFMRYNGHYYAFYHLQANYGVALLTCVGLERSEAENVTTSDRSYPVVLNDQEEQAEIYRFYQENSRVQNSFVWIGGFVRVDEVDVDECENSPDKPTGYNCSDLALMQYLDGSFSTHTAWDPSNAGVNISGSAAAAAAWSRQSNTWLLVTENDGPSVKELICEYGPPNHCLGSDIECVANGVCLQRTAYTERACVCEEGFTGTDCGETDTGTEETAASSSDSGISNTVIYGVIAAACALLLAGGAIAYFRKKRSGHRPPPDVGFRPSVGSAVSGTSTVSVAPSAVSAASGGSVVC